MSFRVKEGLCWKLSATSLLSFIHTYPLGTGTGECGVRARDKREDNSFIVGLRTPRLVGEFAQPTSLDSDF